MVAEQRFKQSLAIAAFAGIGAAVYLLSSHQPPAVPASGTVVSAAPATNPAPNTAAVEIYDPPRPTFTANRIDVMKQTDRAMAQADAKVRAAPDHPEPYVDLAVVYMQKARETADAGYLLRAEAACLKSLSLRPGFYDAMQVLPWIYNSQHRFDEGAAAARQARAKIPADAWNYGTLGDALLELGDYDGARQAYDTMADDQPDSSALARVARLRELMGNPDGAIAVMNDAVEASRSDHPEHFAWALVQRGNFKFNNGRIDAAQSDYSAALAAFTGYHLALAGLARVRMAQAELPESESLYRQALDVAPYQETISGLTDLLLYQHRDADAVGLFDLMAAIEKIQVASHVKPGWLLVLFYADHDIRLADALALARQEAADRKDIKTLDSLAWALYKNQLYDDAAAASLQARRLGTRDALLYFHGGMIERKRGHKDTAIALLRRALEINPHFDVRHAPEAIALLNELTH